MAVSSAESYLLFVSLAYTDTIIGVTEVELRKVLRADKPIKRLANKG